MKFENYVSILLFWALVRHLSLSIVSDVLFFYIIVTYKVLNFKQNSWRSNHQDRRPNMSIVTIILQMKRDELHFTAGN